MKNIHQRIDHTLLKPTATESDIKKLCREAKEHQFKTVCIPPSAVVMASQLLKDSNTQTITVVGFPLGYNLTEAKVLESKLAIQQGATEIDMVINLIAAKSGDWQSVEKDIEAVVQASAPYPVKVIIETTYLNTEEKMKAALAAESAGAAFVKTSTGFATSTDGTPTGAVLDDIRLFRKILKPTTQIKASGGIRDWATAKAMIEAGADRLGTSSGIAILKEIK
jgi:deoxyribose-phosphate aldolase